MTYSGGSSSSAAGTSITPRITSSQTSWRAVAAVRRSTVATAQPPPASSATFARSSVGFTSTPLAPCPAHQGAQPLEIVFRELFPR